MNMILSFSKRYSDFDIIAPRYHDRVVLLAARKVGERNKVKIRDGAFKGEYFVSGVVVTACKLGSNGKIPCYEVPLSMLEEL